MKSGWQPGIIYICCHVSIVDKMNNNNQQNNQWMSPSWKYLSAAVLARCNTSLRLSLLLLYAINCSQCKFPSASKVNLSTQKCVQNTVSIALGSNIINIITFTLRFPPNNSFICIVVFRIIHPANNTSMNQSDEIQAREKFSATPKTSEFIPWKYIKLNLTLYCNKCIHKDENKIEQRPLAFKPPANFNVFFGNLSPLIHCRPFYITCQPHKQTHTYTLIRTHQAQKHLPAQREKARSFLKVAPVAECSCSRRCCSELSETKME